MVAIREAPAVVAGVQDNLSWSTALNPAVGSLRMSCTGLVLFMAGGVVFRSFERVMV